jgi:hypothetical protein
MQGLFLILNLTLWAASCTELFLVSRSGDCSMIPFPFFPWDHTMRIEQIDSRGRRPVGVGALER